MNGEKGKRLFGSCKKAGLKMIRSVWFWLLLLLPAGLLLRVCAQNINGFADMYCGTVYRAISVFFNNISGIVPFSLGELLLMALPAALLVYIVFVIVRTVRARHRRLKTVLNGLLRLIALACAVFFLYVTNCGINYYCTDFASRCSLHARPVSSEELYEVCVFLAGEASALRENLSEDENGVMLLDAGSAQRTAAGAVNGLRSSFGFFPDGYSIPKTVILSGGMSQLKITGVYFPFTFEANFNTEAPDCTLPFTMCHELAHVRGYMQEQDANFIAFLACIGSGSEEFRYSGYLTALMYTSSALRSSDAGRFASFTEAVSDKVRADLAEHSRYWSQFDTPVAETASRINDSYLKANSQSEGVRSYGGLTDLVIAYYYSAYKQRTPGTAQ